MKNRVFYDVSSSASAYPRGTHKTQRVPSSGFRPEKIVLLPEKRSLDYARFAKPFVILVAVWFLVIGSASAPTTTTRAANDPADRAAERKALEAQIAELETQISEYEGQVENYRRQGTTLKNEIKRLDSKVASLNLKLRATRLTLKELSGKIGDTEDRIVILKGSISTHETALAGLLRAMYKNEDTNLVEVFLKNPTLSGFFNDLNNLSLLQANVRTTIVEVKDLRDDLEGEREELLLAKADAETIRIYQETQRQETDVVKQEKDNLLRVTKGQESKYQALLQETKKTAAEIRSRLFELLGGGELTFEQAYDYARLAGQATGMRPALILAVLDRESALGSNVGRCNYKTAMHPTRDIPVFLEIVQKLGIAPDSVMVSCAITSDGAYGGAMGPAQFIPSTWKLYESHIEKVTGRSPANPWNNGDAFVATALYLKDAYDSAGCRDYADANSHILSGGVLQERCAAAKYYAGSRWYRYRFAYGDSVVARADRFEQDIRTIES